MPGRPRLYRICGYCGASYWPKSPRKSRQYCSRSHARLAQGTPKGLQNAGSFRADHAPWNKGLYGYRAGGKRPATGPKIAASMLARPGARITPLHARIRRSTPYKLWRKAIFNRDNYTCQLCGTKSQAGNRITLNADHILPFALYPKERLSLSNGRTLCVPCHKKTPSYGLTGQMAVKA